MLRPTIWNHIRQKWEKHKIFIHRAFHKNVPVRLLGPGSKQEIALSECGPQEPYRDSLFKYE
jgi:hypothetical protein